MTIRGDQVAVTNRRARFDYELLDRWECGIVLEGAEVKSLREGHGNLRDAYARVDDRGEVWLFGLHIRPYEYSKGELDPVRKRKLLLHHREIDALVKATQVKGTTLVPTKLYFKRGRVKVEVASAKGKRVIDKRQVIAKRQADREAERELKERSR